MPSYSGFPACCGAMLVYDFSSITAETNINKGDTALYLAILTEPQRLVQGPVLEALGYEVIKIFKTAHSSGTPYNLYLYASPRPDKDGLINNPGKSPPVPKLPQKKLRFWQRLTWK